MVAAGKLHQAEATELRAAGAAEAKAQESVEQPLRVQLVFMDGREMSFEFQARDRMHNLRTKVATELGVTDTRVRLTLGPRLLRADDRLVEVGVTDGTVLNAIIVPPLYQGSQVYKCLADGLAGALGDGVVDDNVHSALSDVMAKKAELNDTLAKSGFLKRQ